MSFFSGGVTERSRRCSISCQTAHLVQTYFGESIMDLVSIIAVGFGIAYVLIVIHTIITTRG